MLRRSSGGGTARWHPARAVVHWVVRAALLMLLLTLLYKQLAEFRAEPVSTAITRRQAPFPRITLCPGTWMRDNRLRLERQRQLADGNISISSFYNDTTLELLHGELFVQGADPETTHISADVTEHGVWRSRFYQQQHSGGELVWEVRCYTLQPSAALHRMASSEVELQLRLAVPLLFIDSQRSIAYRMFIHGDEEPNVIDLFPRQSGPSVPLTSYAELKPGQDAFFRVTVGGRRLVDLRRRPCRSDDGYSPAQCLKECLWRRLAAHTGCRLPHMVGPGVYLPQLRGPLDHLPLCDKVVRGAGNKRLVNSVSGRYLLECLEESFRNTRPSPSLSEAAGFESGLNTSTAGSEAADEGIQLVPRSLLTNLSGCECQPACGELTYRISADPRTEHIAQPASQCTTQVILKIDLTMDLFEESLSFTVSTLAANAAGFLGLFTGLSLFSVVDVGEALAFSAFARCCVNKSAPSADSASDKPGARAALAWEKEKGPATSPVQCLDDHSQPEPVEGEAAASSSAL
ncbi:hypothetical protein FJT64_013471 [Amphibalanus amphitrite]|uniref:Uncharacterized protein n=1 Tax=Amphibalanus amphitrite TaxID=1232801 RepID=A0A6A4V091_AMPAM|nr:hypothetical protein FJT64_013471 [Amphibalanus amphitrite]